MIVMFQRSEIFYNVKYANYIGDGDSKTFKKVLNTNLYENFTVKRKEYMGHVQKRMEACLQNLKKNEETQL